MKGQNNWKFSIYLSSEGLIAFFLHLRSSLLPPVALFYVLYIVSNISILDDVIMSQRNGRMGRLLSPRHTLPPNTTCTYYFHGFPNDLIWLSFTSHHLQLLQPVNHDNLTQSFGQVS